jgi:outer membrane receptor protein involved in Fe transport
VFASSSRRLSLPLFAIGVVLFGALGFSQSTGNIGGTVTDAAGSAVPNASVTVHNQGTGAEQVTKTDAAGIYLVPSLPVGTYRVEVKSPGMQPTAASAIALSVGSTIRQDFALQVASTTTVVEVSGAAPLVDSSTNTLGSVVNQATVQEIPLNGRHFIDLSLLTPGTMTPPANGFLTAPLRGQGSFSFNSAGAREDSVNFMINGVNLSDPNQNQITFQPTINTVEEFKIDNSTFSAEYGRNSGSIVNIATRAGENVWHGEAYEFLRNDFLDARNFGNPTNTVVNNVLTPSKENEFVRNQFGGDGGGAIIKNKLFAFLSYEGLRQRQAVALPTSTVLTAAQRTQALATSDTAVKDLLALVPLPNSGTNGFTGSASAPVNIEQGTANISYMLNAANRLNFYYAIQRDQRNEPPTTDGNSFPNEGDQRNGTRQLLTFNESWTISPTLTNEFRAGANRIHIVFAADNMDAAPAFDINSGITTAIGLPHITVTNAFTFGGNSGFPQGRGDNVGTFSDTLSWVHGNHIVKFGGEFRRQNSDNFSATPGTFNFPSLTAFLADQANAFTVTDSNRSNRTYGNSIGAFVTDTWKLRPTFSLTLGVRYDWYGTPTEAENRFTVFDPTTSSLLPVGKPGGPSTAYQQSALNFEPRVGFVWDPFKTGKTVVRSGYGIMTDQPSLGLVTGLAGNPPNAFPISYTPPAGSFVTLENAFPLANGSISPVSVAHNYHDAYVSEWNFNIEQQLGKNYAVTLSYVGSKGTDLNIERNYNQFVNGVRPFAKLSATSPIDPGLPLTNISVYESDGNSSYQALWLTAEKRLSKGLQFKAAYTYSKSIDDNSQNNEGVVIQDSNNIRGDRGLSDFDARNRFVLSAIYALPFQKNIITRGWQLSAIETLQSGNPLNFHIANSAFTGNANLRPDVTGKVITGFDPANFGALGIATDIGYVQNPTVFVNQGTTPGVPIGFGNLGRNVVTGPGFSNLDLALVRNIRFRERMNFQIRADAYDLLNHPNFTNPATTLAGTDLSTFATVGTLGQITGGTRAPSGDFGSSRQIQLALKLQF